MSGLFVFLLSYHTEYILILKSLEPGDEGTSLTSCSVSCVDVVVINGALMSVCGEQSIAFGNSLGCLGGIMGLH